MNFLQPSYLTESMPAPSVPQQPNTAVSHSDAPHAPAAISMGNPADDLFDGFYPPVATHSLAPAPPWVPAVPPLAPPEIDIPQDLMGLFETAQARGYSAATIALYAAALATRPDVGASQQNLISLGAHAQFTPHISPNPDGNLSRAMTPPPWPTPRFASADSTPRRGLSPGVNTGGSTSEPNALTGSTQPGAPMGYGLANDAYPDADTQRLAQQFRDGWAFVSMRIAASKQLPNPRALARATASFYGRLTAGPKVAELGDFEREFNALKKLAASEEKLMREKGTSLGSTRYAPERRGYVGASPLVHALVDFIEVREKIDPSFAQLDDSTRIALAAKALWGPFAEEGFALVDAYTDSVHDLGMGRVFLSLVVDDDLRRRSQKKGELPGRAPAQNPAQAKFATIHETLTNLFAYHEAGSYPIADVYGGPPGLQDTLQTAPTLVPFLDSLTNLHQVFNIEGILGISFAHVRPLLIPPLYARLPSVRLTHGEIAFEQTCHMLHPRLEPVLLRSDSIGPYIVEYAALMETWTTTGLHPVTGEPLKPTQMLRPIF